ncbi:MAG: RNA-binding S4 domain-containing protein [Bacteroidota bacterium]
MRIDKYLWSIRVYKTRSQAAEACKKNRVVINDIPVKSSREVKLNEIIRVRKNQINYEYKVLDIPKSRVGAKLVADYCINVTPKEETDKLDVLKYSKNYFRDRGTGRPTKRDRRDLDTYFEKDEDDEWDDLLK